MYDMGCWFAHKPDEVPKVLAKVESWLGSIHVVQRREGTTQLVCRICTLPLPNLLEAPSLRPSAAVRCGILPEPLPSPRTLTVSTVVLYYRFAFPQLRLPVHQQRLFQQQRSLLAVHLVSQLLCEAQ